MANTLEKGSSSLYLRLRGLGSSVLATATPPARYEVPRGIDRAPYNRPAEELEWQVVTRQAAEQMGVVVIANLLP